MVIVPVYNKVLAPKATLFLTLEQLRRSAGDKSIAVNEKVVLLVAKENSSLSDLGEDSFYPIGVSDIVKEIHQQGYVTVSAQHRC